MRKEIVVLAVSSKPPGRCVAGIEILSGGFLGNWVRPINPKTQNGLDINILNNQNYREIKLLDIVSVILQEKNLSVPHQPENFTLIPKKSYETTFFHSGYLDKSVLVDYIDDSIEWPLGSHSSGKINNRVSSKNYRLIDRSLYLVKCPVDIIIEVGNDKKNPDISGSFTVKSVPYKLSITDLEIRKAFSKHEENSIIPIPMAIMCISLGEDFNGHAYKLIASLIIF